MREGFVAAIRELGKNSDFQILTGDHGYALFEDFEANYPQQLHNLGIAESNLVGVSAGLSRAGFRPLIYGLASFIPSRVYEFLKLQISLDALPVIVVGDGGGLVYSQLGHSHQSLDDLALVTSLPNFRVFSPSSDEEMSQVVRQSYSSSGPTYIRIGKSDGGFAGSFPNSIIEPYLVTSGSMDSIALITHGAMTARVHGLMSAGEIPNLDMWSCPTIFPIPQSFMEILLDRYTDVIIIEEHLETGGLKSMLLNLLGQTSTRVHGICADRAFHHGVGSYSWALGQHGLGNQEILGRIDLILKDLSRQRFPKFPGNNAHR